MFLPNQDSCDIIDVCKNCSEHCSVLENCYDVCLPTVENSSTILKKHTPTFVFDTTESSDMKYEMQHVINKASLVEQRLYYVGDVQNISIDIPVPKPDIYSRIYLKVQGIFHHFSLTCKVMVCKILGTFYSYFTSQNDRRSAAIGGKYGQLSTVLLKSLEIFPLFMYRLQNIYFQILAYFGLYMAFIETNLNMLVNDLLNRLKWNVFMYRK